MQLPRGPPAGLVKLTKLNGVSWARGIRSVIVSNGCDRILPTGVQVPLDWLDDCAPAASAAGEEDPSAIVEVSQRRTSPMLQAEVDAVLALDQRPWRIFGMISWWIFFSLRLLVTPGYVSLGFKCLSSDRAKEFIVKWFEDWLESVGAVHELSMAYTAQQNATVERYNGVLQNVARSIHLESKLTKSFWPYAFLAACYLRNRLPNQGDKTPYELFFGVLPDVSLLRVFGCPCYVTLVNGKKRNKLDERALSGRLVGYSLVSKGYFVWVPKLRQVVESRDVLFYEQFSYNCIPGLFPYDGSQYFSRTPAAIIGKGLDTTDNVLGPLPTPIVDRFTGHGMTMRPRPGGRRAFLCATFRRHCDDVAVTDDVSDDLEHWSGSDTAYGWGVPVYPGFDDLEAKEAGLVQPRMSAALGALLPVTADTADIPAALYKYTACYEG
eukprot:gene23924-biopygen18427